MISGKPYLQQKLTVQQKLIELKGTLMQIWKSPYMFVFT